MSAILNSLNAYNVLIFQPILMILVLKFMVYRALSDKTYLLLGLRSSLTLKAIKSSFERSYDKQNITLVVISYEIYQTSLIALNEPSASLINFI